MENAMLLGMLFMLALAGVDAYRDHEQRKPMSWPAFLSANRRQSWWTSRRSKAERAAVAMSVGKEA